MEEFNVICLFQLRNTRLLDNIHVITKYVFSSLGISYMLVLTIYIVFFSPSSRCAHLREMERILLMDLCVRAGGMSWLIITRACKLTKLNNFLLLYLFNCFGKQRFSGFWFDLDCCSKIKNPGSLKVRMH